MSARASLLVVAALGAMVYGYLKSPDTPTSKPPAAALQSLSQPVSPPTPSKEVRAAIGALEFIPLPRPRPSIRPAPPKAEVLLTAAVIAAILVQASRQAYYATGRSCACPDDEMRNGRRCGARSAYSRPGGAQPLCYATDVTPAMIESYRSRKSRTGGREDLVARTP